MAEYYSRRYKPSPAFKSRKATRRATAAAVRDAVVTANRGFLRTYGRFRGRTATPGSEMKFFDTVLTSTAIPDTGAILNASLNLVPQGDTESERTGRKIIIRSINIRGMVRNDSGTTEASTTNRVRLLLYQDKQTNGAAAGVTDILETATINSFNQLANRSRFVTHMDKMFDLVSAAGANSDATTPVFGRDMKSFSFFKKCYIPIEFDNSATTGAITTIRSNNLGILGISWNTSDDAATEYVVRIRYTDN